MLRIGLLRGVTSLLLLGVRLLLRVGLRLLLRVGLLLEVCGLSLPLRSRRIGRLGLGRHLAHLLRRITSGGRRRGIHAIRRLHLLPRLHLHGRLRDLLSRRVDWLVVCVIANDDHAR